MKAKESFVSVPLVSHPSKLQDLIHPFDLTPYENILAELQTIDDKIGLAKLARQRLASNQLIDADGKLAGSETAVQNAQVILKPQVKQTVMGVCLYEVASSSVDSAAQLAQSATTLSAKASELLVSAERLDSTLTSEIKLQKPRLDALNAEIAAIRGAKAGIHVDHCP